RAFFLRSDQDGEAEDDLVPMFRRNGPADAASSGFEIPEHGIEADPVLRFGEHLIEFVLGHRNAQLLLTNLLTKRRGTFLLPLPFAVRWLSRRSAAVAYGMAVAALVPS